MIPSLKIVSLFRTIDGECTSGGPLQWSTFVRLGGCNIRCWKSSGFCDAPHSLDINGKYREVSVPDLLVEILAFNTPRVTITGGEPLLQKEGLRSLATRVHLAQKVVTLETNGTVPFGLQDAMAFDAVILDLKPPSTEMHKKMHFENLGILRKRDFVKAVIENYEDFVWALDIFRKYPTKAHIAIGPRHGYLEPSAILKWIEEHERFDIQLNVQIHKYIWPGTVDIKGYEKLSDVNIQQQIDLEV